MRFHGHEEKLEIPSKMNIQMTGLRSHNIEAKLNGRSNIFGLLLTKGMAAHSTIETTRGPSKHGLYMTKGPQSTIETATFPSAQLLKFDLHVLNIF